MEDVRAALVARLSMLGQISSTETAMFQQRAAAHYGLGITDMKALDLLVRDGPMTAGGLAAALRLTSGAVTGVIDRLSGRGMVGRESDPTDRRKVMVVADLGMLTAGPNVYESIGRAFAELHDSYSTSQLEFLVQYLEKSVELTRAEAARIVPG